MSAHHFEAIDALVTRTNLLTDDSFREDLKAHLRRWNGQVALVERVRNQAEPPKGRGA